VQGRWLGSAQGNTSKHGRPWWCHCHWCSMTRWECYNDHHYLWSKWHIVKREASLVTNVAPNHFTRQYRAHRGYKYPQWIMETQMHWVTGHCLLGGCHTWKWTGNWKPRPGQSQLEMSRLWREVDDWYNIGELTNQKMGNTGREPHDWFQPWGSRIGNWYTNARDSRPWAGGWVESAGNAGSELGGS